MLTQAMVFAAGFGKRLRPLTDKTPKPLISIGSTTCLDETLKKLKAAGIERVTLNTHHLAEQIHAHLKENYPSIVISHEPEILETGGGLLKALPHFDQTKPVLVVNGDVWWKDTLPTVFECLGQTWNPEIMDCLLCLVPKETAIGYSGKGDYFLKSDQRLDYRGDFDSAPYAHSGILVIAPALFKGETRKIFSLKDMFDKAERQRRLFGLVHKGLWGDIGSERGLEGVRHYV